MTEIKLTGPQKAGPYNELVFSYPTNASAFVGKNLGRGIRIL